MLIAAHFGAPRRASRAQRGDQRTKFAIAPTTSVDPDLLIVTSPSRLLLLQPPPYTQAPAQLPGPQAGAVTGSAFDSRGNLLATDFNALYLFDPAGTLRRVVPLPKFTPETWLDTITNEHITHAMVVPTMLARIVEAIRRDAALAPMLAVVTPTLQLGGIAGNFSAGISRSVVATCLV